MYYTQEMGVLLACQSTNVNIKKKREKKNTRSALVGRSRTPRADGRWRNRNKQDSIKRTRTRTHPYGFAKGEWNKGKGERRRGTLYTMELKALLLDDSTFFTEPDATVLEGATGSGARASISCSG